MIAKIYSLLSKGFLQCPFKSTGGSAIRITVTGAAGQIGYSLLPLIAKGLMLGPHQPVVLQLLEIEPAIKALQGVALEIEDGSYPLVQEIICTSDTSIAFKDTDIAILVGSFPRKKGMERKDLLEKNAAIFKAQGEALEKYASRNVKVLVVGNPANTNCAICQACAPSIPKENFSALTRLDMNRARSHIALRAKVTPNQVRNVIIWGNHSATQYPDVNHSTIVSDRYHLKELKVRDVIQDDVYLNGAFIDRIQKRGAEILAMRGLSSAMSAANAVVDHIRDWIVGVRSGEYISMAVTSDGSYGIPKGLIFSFPVLCTGNGHYKIVQNLEWDSFSKEKIKITTQELIEERDIAFKFLGLQ